MDGSNKIENTKTPIPPNQCVKLLQNKIPFGKDSISVKMDDPVVVKPDNGVGAAATYKLKSLDEFNYFYATKPNVEFIKKSELKLAEKIDELMQTAIDTTEVIMVEAE